MSILQISSLTSGIGGIRILQDVSLDIKRGKIHAILGANGAGKTTLLRSIMGLANVHGGRVSIDGKDTTRWPTWRIVREARTAMIPEGRQIFSNLTVRENLIMGTTALRITPAVIESRIMDAIAMFPVLGKKINDRARGLSGGEQQMLAIARAIMSDPQLILADEVSLGLAPIIVRQLIGVFGFLVDRGVTVVLVEQNTTVAMDVSETVTILKSGRVVADGPTDTLGRSETIDLYLR